MSLDENKVKNSLKTTRFNHYPPRMDRRPEKIYSQRMQALERYCTKFEWVLPDWSLLYDNTYSRGIKSDSFPLHGVPPCTCRLFLNLQDKESNIHILLSDPASILAAKVTLIINENLPSIWSLSQPVLKNDHLGIIVSQDKKEIWDVMNIDPSKEVKDTLTIVANFVVTPFPAPLPYENPAPTNVLRKMKALFGDKKFCDVTLVFDNEEIPAHKSVLAAHSEVFQAMFSSRMTENEENRVTIVDIDAKLFREFLNYLYTGQVNNLKDSVEEMIMVADKYQVTELKEMCANFMLKNLNTKNVVQYILIADKLCCNKLKKEALHLLQNSLSVYENVIKESNVETVAELSKILRDSLKT
ncbi:TD and POZ domain-containing protein 3-like [Venturia canescens]|uniref:TD and POZ domain-containing protein 3-like n=1 Tax=Venturia canescens TaxID=32260 RepID=UPI001C9CDA12|nr:TD and POZ domain-containing protein 3-like [Venturia canescens]